jgi:hypothetical protein
MQRPGPDLVASIDQSAGLWTFALLSGLRVTPLSAELLEDLRQWRLPIEMHSIEMHSDDQPNDRPSAQLPSASLVGVMLVQGVIDEFFWHDLGQEWQVNLSDRGSNRLQIGKNGHDEIAPEKWVVAFHTYPGLSRLI